MSFQNYIANVSFGANTTGPFVILANTFQDAARQAAQAYDQNTAVTLANGEIRFAARLNPGVVNSVGSNNRSLTVTVIDPSAPTFGAPNTFVMTVATTAISPVVAAVYNA